MEAVFLFETSVNMPGYKGHSPGYGNLLLEILKCYEKCQNVSIISAQQLLNHLKQALSTCSPRHSVRKHLKWENVLYHFPGKAEIERGSILYCSHRVFSFVHTFLNPTKRTLLIYYTIQFFTVKIKKKEEEERLTGLVTSCVETAL
jgi:hypothetical protein